MINRIRLPFTVAAITFALLLFAVGQAVAAVHTVSKGESLFLISKWYGTSVEALKAANNLTGDEIRPGQRLTIPSNKTHTVSAGDTLFLIAQRYGTTHQAIKAANNLNGDEIRPGQRLIIPAGNTYTVRSGDTLFTIAKQHGTTYQALMAASGLSSSAIYPGQVLRLPANKPVPAAPVSRGGAIGNVSAADLDLLARIITAEADNQTYQTQVAVGAVILNRVKSPLFPNTIRGVVYQVDSGGRYQFEPVLNGWINRPASDSARRAAREALSGTDPTNGALFFWESWVRNSYLNSRPVATVMGAFTFTY